MGKKHKLIFLLMIGLLVIVIACEKIIPGAPEDNGTAGAEIGNLEIVSRQDVS